MTDSDNDKKRRGLRRGQRQQVNYRETSESSDNSAASASKKKVKPRGRPRKEHLSSDYSDGQSRQFQNFLLVSDQEVNFCFFPISIAFFPRHRGRGGLRR